VAAVEEIARRRSFGFKFLLACAVLLIGIALTSSLWLSALGAALVHEDGPARADIAVVMAGDYGGNRILTAAGLVRAGYVPAVLVSGPPGFYGANECDAAIRFVIAKGYPAQWFIPAPHNAYNTRDESKALLEDLQRRHVRSFLLVTSDYHTARSRRLFLAAERAVGGGPGIRMVAAPDQFFTAGAWWRNREGRKTAFMEWLKTITGALGI
jgi:uncharacterized SAM-binding protein YcdF (DUF218 family)